jgi:hypothetical protein
MITNNEARRIIIKKIVTKQSDEFFNLEDIHPLHFIELYDRELNYGIHILRDDCTKILKNKLNGSWLIRRASIKGTPKLFPFIISYKYFNIYNYIFCFIENKGICELDPRYYNGGDQLPDSYDTLKIKNTCYKNMFELFEHYGLTFPYKIIKKFKKEIEMNSILE